MNKIREWGFPVGLIIALKVHAADRDASGDRVLPDARADLALADDDLARKADVHRRDVAELDGHLHGEA